MNKTISITLAGIIFHIEEDAFVKLKKYLDEIRAHFAADETTDEDIMDDIEASVAEKFSALLKKSKQVINDDDVQEVISVMGDVVDYQSEEPGIRNQESVSEDDKVTQENDNKQKDASEDVPKKLFRNPDDVVIAGVCSGLASYLGIDPVIVRVIFVASLFFGGAGILIYIILWLVMPEAKTSSQKLEMQGKPVTIDKLEKAYKEKIEPKIGNAGNAAKRIIDLPFRALAAVFRVIKKFFMALGPIFRWLISFAIVISAIIGIFFMSLLAAVLVFNFDSELINTGINFEELSQVIPFNLAVISVWLIALIPLLFVLLVGLSIWSKRKIFNFAITSTLLGAWMLAIIMFTVLAIDASPRIERYVHEYNLTENVEQEFDFVDFNKLEIQNAYQATIVPGEEFFIKAIGKEADLERLDLRQRGNELVIAKEWQSGICLFCYDRDVKFEISLPELVEINAGGAAKIAVSGFSGEKLVIDYGGAIKSEISGDYKEYEIELTGASKLDFTTSSSTEVIKSDISGASKIYFQGLAETVTIDVSGASKVFAFPLLTKEANIEASGASQVEISVSDEITVDASGASKVFYKGKPEIFQKSSGSSRIEKMSWKEDDFDGFFEEDGKKD